MKPVQLVFVSDGEEAWRTVQVADAPARSPRCVLVLPGAHVLAREIEVAGATPAQNPRRRTCDARARACPTGESADLRPCSWRRAAGRAGRR